MVVRDVLIQGYGALDRLVGWCHLLPKNGKQSGLGCQIRTGASWDPDYCDVWEVAHPVGIERPYSHSALGAVRALYHLPDGVGRGELGGYVGAPCPVEQPRRQPAVLGESHEWYDLWTWPGLDEVEGPVRDIVWEVLPAKLGRVVGDL